MKTNVPVSSQTPVTHEGGKAATQSPLLELTRTVSTCLLWENTFYEKGSDIAARMAALCDLVPLADIAKLAIKAGIRVTQSQAKNNSNGITARFAALVCHPEGNTRVPPTAR